MQTVSDIVADALARAIARGLAVILAGLEAWRVELLAELAVNQAAARHNPRALATRPAMLVNGRPAVVVRRHA